MHKVQVLDPATGTGTFLAEVIKHVHQKFKNQAGIWPKYVENDLIPRLNGFELLMTSYAIAHLKMDILLTETGFTNPNNKRFKIFLTNSLEEAHENQFNLFTQWLSQEANEANAIKKDAPVMCVIGNPPYSGESANKGEWIMKLMEDYKKEPGGKEKLKEQNSKFINDDYVKFIRFSQHFIEKNGEGVLAFINPHGFLDNPTFRGMRWNLLKTFDKIYTIDLHGNAKKKETAPDGSADVNVFGIEQGVSINLFVKTGKKKPSDLGMVHHFDLFGKRDYKYDFLSTNDINSINFKVFRPFENSYLFKQIDESEYRVYTEGFNPTELFKVNVMGFQTHRDHFCIDEKKTELVNRLTSFATSEISELDLSLQFDIKSSSDFNINEAKTKLKNFNIHNEVISCGYRPFDNRFIYFDRVVVDRPRKELINHVKQKENVLLGIGRQGLAVGDIDWCLTTISKHPVDANIFRRGGVNLFPLYLYPEKSDQQSLENEDSRIPNLKEEIVTRIAKSLKLKFVSEKQNDKLTFSPIDIVDYIYSILHSPHYRNTYKEFLKTDFPRLPYPTDADKFWKLVALGKELREIHLLESPKVEEYITGYPEDGDNIVGKPTYKNESVYINETQYFSNVPEVAWNFYIGGYQPAQKWLKDRKERELSYDDILHYQKIIVALSETDRIMKEIDEVGM